MEQKSKTAEREESVIAFWKKHNIFQKSLKKPAPKGEFVFYDGPPFATGLPHYGSLLSSIIKDVIPRYKTMRGYYVRRRWGWDCHGLPIENMIEKELGIETKKGIEEFGIEKFIEACRASVLRYADGWKKYIDRVGRWVEYDNAYKTMDVTYMESVWWALERLHKKGLLYEGRKVLLYCPHCETPLAKAEIQMDNSYKDVTEEAVTVKFKVRDPEKHGLPKNTYLLAWTTTPWTLPGNVALAVGKDIEYVVFKEGSVHLVIAKALYEGNETVATLQGSDLVDIAYEPLYTIDAVQKTNKKAWYVAAADFVNTEEGTGIVHTAVIYGEDDYALGVQLDLPMVPLLDERGHFTDAAPDFIAGKYFKQAEDPIKNDLEKRGLLFKKEMHTHSYPHCHRCDTALLYNAITSWFINIQKVKSRLLRLNKRINWVPEHLKEGRFRYVVENAPDWTISRNRYWASPLPIWRCQECDELHVIGSVAELAKHTQQSGNRYFVMRHGEAQSNKNDEINYKASKKDPLTETALIRIQRTCERMREGDFDLIVTSPLERTKETAELVAKHLKLEKKKLVVDERLQELQVGDFQGKSWNAYHDALTPLEQFTKPIAGGETRREVKQRAGNVLYELEAKYKDKNILLVTHEGVFEALLAAGESASFERSVALAQGHSLGYAELKSLPLKVLPHNKYYELDLHRPYIDDITLACSCGSEMYRIPEVVDGWVESGSMPFAEYHYPFENKRTFKKRFPGDFVAEYIAQTRTWFYYMHAIAGMLFRKPAFKNVVTTGNILAADGSKMSKSKGNYTDPLENLNKYGADALRYYLMTSTVMQAEDTRFLDEELREAHNRVVNILWNVFRFHDMYAGDIVVSAVSEASTHPLDQWIRVRFAEATREITESFEAFNTIAVGKSLRAFVDDFSTWYLRRSRDRFRSSDKTDAGYAIATTRYVLRELAKLAAPLMPFIAESIYQGVRGDEDAESVHLESWPEAAHISSHDTKLLTDMAAVRDVVSRALEARARAGIKVRQPLGTLMISTAIPDDYLFLIQDEVNVKKVVVDTDMTERTRLDTEITDALRQEGQVRELIRYVQEARKHGGFKPDEKGRVLYTSDKQTQLAPAIEKEIALATNTVLTYTKDVSADRNLTVGDMQITLVLKPEA